MKIDAFTPLRKPTLWVLPNGGPLLLAFTWRVRCHQTHTHLCPHPPSNPEYSYWRSFFFRIISAYILCMEFAFARNPYVSKMHIVQAMISIRKAPTFWCFIIISCQNQRSATVEDHLPLPRIDMILSFHWFHVNVQGEYIFTSLVLKVGWVHHWSNLDSTGCWIIQDSTGDTVLPAISSSE